MDNTAEAITAAVRKAQAEREVLRDEMAAWRRSRAAVCARQVENLKRVCGIPAQTGGPR